MMEGKGFNVIEGGKAEVLDSYEKLFHGEIELSDANMEKLLGAIAAIDQHEVIKDYSERIYWLFDYLTALVWKINDLTTRKLGADSDGYLRDNVKWVPLENERRMVLLHRMEEFTGVGHYETNIQVVRLAALRVAKKLEDDLDELCAHYSVLEEEGDLRVEMLVPNLPLMVGGMLNLYTVLGDKLKELKSILTSLQRSLTVVGKSVDVNFLMVEGVTIQVLRAVNLLRMFRKTIQVSGVPKAVDEVEVLLDKGLIYPDYHEKIIQSCDDVICSLSNDTSLVNFCEKSYRELKKMFLLENLRKLKSTQKIDGISSSDEDIQVNYVEDSEILPNKILQTIDQMCEYDLIDEAETLMRVYKMITNTDDVVESGGLEMFYQEWKDRETKLKYSIQSARMENFRNA